MEGQVDLHIDAPPGRLWRMVADVTRMHEWSPETFRCEWLDGAEGPEEGARFRGHNQMWFYKWSTVSTVDSALEGREFAFHTTVRGKVSTRWKYTFEPDRDGTKVTESYQLVYSPAYYRVTYPFTSRKRRLELGMSATLAKLKSAAESGGGREDSVSGPVPPG